MGRPKPSGPAGGDQGVALLVQRLQLPVGEICFNNSHIREIRLAAAGLGQPLVNGVVRIGESFNDERDIIAGTERTAISLQHHVGPFARKARRHMQKAEFVALHYQVVIRGNLPMVVPIELTIMGITTPWSYDFYHG